MFRFTKNSYLPLLAGLFVILAAAVPAKADIVWTFSDIELSDGATLNGSFSLNVYGYLSNWDISVTGGESGIANYTYAPDINASINATRTQVDFYRDDPAYYGSLQLTFDRPLTYSGTDPIVDGIGSASFECGGWICGGNSSAAIRYVVTDGIPMASAVPEPASWVMVLVGLGGVGFMVRRRSRTDRR